ncbi:MAG: Clp protease ClpP [Firmicutes bacterium HGW-Firmicutes-15]|nr:MAG: Clp protease ClpP [Firmicutes bacterium HGW-Firmicutes-15]
MKKFFAFKNKDESNTELNIYGDIVSMKWFENDVTHYDFADELAQVTTPNLTVRINSYGGEVSQGLGIYNLLREWKGHVTTICDGFACSAASVVFVAGKTRVMPKTSLLMIHNAWTIASGDSEDFKKMAEDLAKINEPIIQSYCDATGLPVSKIQKMMNEETWLTAEEAFEMGFATKIQEESAKASLESSILFGLVEKLKNVEKQLNPKQEPINAWEKYFGKK